MHPPIKLIVGLGNPGPEYAKTRHNAGAWFVEELAKQFGASLQLETKFQGQMASVSIEHQDAYLLVPATFMNNSGQAVRAISQYFKIPPESILIAHDELDFPPGLVRLKQDGGHGGHNGLRDIITHLHANNFSRLRIGIGHPGNRNEVHDYVLTPPPKQDHSLIFASIEHSISIMSDLVKGDIQKAMKSLHTPD